MATVDGEWVTQREASAYIDCVAATQARRALACGLAGPARRSGRRLYYRFADVQELAARQPINEDSLAALGPLGAMLLRLPATVAASTIEADLDRWLVGPWQPSLPVLLLTEAVLGQAALPVVVTVSGFVVACRDLVSVAPSDRGVTFGLATAGGWSEAVHRHRWPQRGGGPPLRHVQIAAGGLRHFC